MFEKVKSFFGKGRRGSYLVREDPEKIIEAINAPVSDYELLFPFEFAKKVSRALIYADEIETWKTEGINGALKIAWYCGYARSFLDDKFEETYGSNPKLLELHVQQGKRVISVLENLANLPESQKAKEFAVENKPYVESFLEKLTTYDSGNSELEFKFD